MKLKELGKGLLGIAAVGCMLVLSGCVNATPTPVDTPKEELVSSVEESKEESTQVEEAVESSEESTEVSSASEEVSEAVDTTEAEGAGQSEETDAPADAVAENLSAIKAFLYNGMTDEAFQGHDGEYDELIHEASFAVADVNQDGYKDVLVKGYLGLRCKELSDIGFFNGKEIVEVAGDGSPYGYRDNYIYFQDPDYAQAGAIIYDVNGIYEVNPDFKLEQRLYCSIESIMFDEETGEELEQSIDNKFFTMNGEEITEEEYFDKLPDYMEGYLSFEFHELTKENIEEFVQ